ncbi:MAG TPA: trigger factor, partial [Gemmatimonadaceae bacterium]|nr:trigger factor [Gemmatimonadaceae bacterium]
MEIQITPKSSTGVERAVEVTVPAAEIAAAEEKTTRRYASSVRLPGFRPGKAPVAVVKKRFAEAIRNETIETVVREAYKEIVSKDDIKIASQPHIHGLSFEEGKPLTFEFHYEVRPTVELTKTSGFRVERNAVALTDTQVQEQIDHLRDQQAALTPIDDKPLEGDMVRVALTVADDTGTMGEGRDVTLVLGDGRAIPGIEELIMEAAPGATVERPVRWPDDFPDEKQRGQTKTVRAVLHEVKRKTLPDFDDAFARQVGDFDSADALRAAVRDDMQKHLDREADGMVRQRLIDEVITANPFDIPKSWIQELVQNYIKTYEISEEQRPQLEGEFKTLAERQIKRDLIVETLAEREHLTATEKDLDDRIGEQAEARKISASELYMTLEKAGRLKEMERSLTDEKVFHWLMAQNE